MGRDRSLLALSKIDEFAAWMEGRGWKREKPLQFSYEVLRMTKAGNTLVLYKRMYATKHCTVHGQAIGLVRKWINERDAKIGGE